MTVHQPRDRRATPADGPSHVRPPGCAAFWLGRRRRARAGSQRIQPLRALLAQAKNRLQPGPCQYFNRLLNGIRDDASYQAKFGVRNPNLKVLKTLREHGVELLVCGQNLASDKIDSKSVSTEVKVASDGLIVLMTYQNRGYALLSF